MQVSVTVLGPLTVTSRSGPVPVTAPRLRAVLATLAMSAGAAVSVERLAAAVWAERLPTDARRTVQVYVTRLRALLGRETIGTSPAGYRLRARVDALRFLHLAEAAAASRDERATLAEALALWRGSPFDGVCSDWLHGIEAPRLTERRLAVLQRRLALDVSCGRSGAVLAELRGLTARHRLHEPFWGLLMEALYCAGRQAEALAAYRDLRRILDEELGVQPGPALRDLHRSILAADPSIAPTSPVRDRPVARPRSGTVRLRRSASRPR